MIQVRYALEALALYVLYGLFKLMPVGVASGFGGWLGRVIGPRLAASRKALRNLERALPKADGGAVIAGMWENLGRVMAEYPHLEAIARDRTMLEGEAFEAERTIYIGAHLGNWEVNVPAPFLQLGMGADLTYRAPNNPWSAHVLERARTLKGQLAAHAKSRTGGKALMKAAKEGRNIGMLIDQKYNEGVSVPFFGRGAMTNPVFVQLAQKYGLRVVPVQNVREEGPNFRLIVHPPLKLFDENGNPLPELDVIKQAHTVLEGWITERPEQWLWLHRRWKD